LGISKPDLLAQVTEFCKEHDLEEKTSVFQKGALVAQHPESFEDIKQLDEDDKVPIRQEKTRELSMAIHDDDSKLKSRQMAFDLGIILYRRYLLTWLSYLVRQYL
jgi:hypothetical protein